MITVVARKELWRLEEISYLCEPFCYQGPLLWRIPTRQTPQQDATCEETPMLNQNHINVLNL